VVSLGSVQLKIMRVLWDEGKATARRVTDVLSEQSPVAHSTVQTLIRQLEAKKAVAHEQSDRTFLYYALIQEHEVGRSVAQDVLSRVFQGSISGLVAHLLDSETISDDEMGRLRRLLDEKRKEGER
jgi:BlaI family penicillinase repressor